MSLGSLGAEHADRLVAPHEDLFSDAAAFSYGSTPDRTSALVHADDAPMLIPNRSGIHVDNVAVVSVRNITVSGDANAPELPSRVLQVSPFEDFQSRRSPNVTFLASAGYGQPPDVPLVRDKVARELLDILTLEHGIGLGYANGGRGGAHPVMNRSKWGIKTIASATAREMRGITNDMALENPDMKYVLGGHSQGAQLTGHVLAHPEHFGFRRGAIRGAVLWNTVPMPNSQRMLLNRRFWPLIFKALPSLARSLVSGKGITFSDHLAYQLFFGEGDENQTEIRRLLENAFPADTAYFPQTLVVGTSPRFAKGQLKGIPVSIVASEEDQLMPLSGAISTADHLLYAGADVQLLTVPGGHFSAIVTTQEESSERLALIRLANREAMEHAFSKL